MKLLVSLAIGTVIGISPYRNSFLADLLVHLAGG